MLFICFEITQKHMFKNNKVIHEKNKMMIYDITMISIDIHIHEEDGFHMIFENMISYVFFF